MNLIQCFWVGYLSNVCLELGLFKYGNNVSLVYHNFIAYWDTGKSALYKTIITQLDSCFVLQHNF